MVKKMGSFTGTSLELPQLADRLARFEAMCGFIGVSPFLVLVLISSSYILISGRRC